MGVNWTPDQLSAIELKGNNLLIAAAAGSGKTTVLVERIIRKITDSLHPVDVDRLLVTTFTNAAAAKMRQEIYQAIEGELAKNPNDKNLAKQLVLMNRASICTIHSFCLDVVRENFHLLDLPPDFKISDTSEAELLKSRAADEVLEELYEQADPDFLELCAAYSNQRSDNGVVSLMLSVHSFVKAMPFFDQWLQDMAQMFLCEGGFENSVWATELSKDIKLRMAAMLDLASKAKEAAEADPLIAPYAATLQADIEALEQFNRSTDGSWDEMVAAAGRMEFVRLASIKGLDEEKKAPVKEVREQLKKQRNDITGMILNRRSSEIEAELSALWGRMNALGRLVVAFDERFSQLKRDQRAVDFNDLEHLCLKLLADRSGGEAVPTQIALELRAKYEEILIDEYQDANELQETIFSLISTGKNMFMVGDIKQSIYRFRHTNPLLFKNKKETYTQDGTGDGQKVIMSSNFRSRKNIIDCANYLFRIICSELIGEIVYDESEQLNAGAVYPDISERQCMKTEIHLMNMQKEDKPPLADAEEGTEQEEVEDLSAIESEAMMVAQRIEQLVAQPFMVQDKKAGMRPVKYKDIVILMRATSDAAGVFAAALEQRGIPAYADTGGGGFMSIEVRTVLSMLEVIDNPRQDIPLLALLRSPILGFDDNAIAEIRLCDRSGDIYTAVCVCAGGDTPLGERCVAFLKTLEDWREQARYLPVHELIWKLISDTGYYGIVGALSSGQQRQANLRLLFERARAYDATSFKGLFHFINYINKTRDGGGDMGSAKQLGENQNVVRIMSIHKSKGLEFPVVFVSRLGKRFNLRDMAEPVLLHKKLGFGPEFVHTQLRYSYPTHARQAIRSRMRYEAYSEEMRLLYVAMTRAKEKLILTASVKDAAKATDRWNRAVGGYGEQMAPHQVSSASGFLDWVMPPVLNHPDLAKTDEPEQWSIRYWTPANLRFIAPEPKPTHQQSEEKGNALFVKERLDYQYPFESAYRIPTKITVSEYKRLGAVEDSIEDNTASIYELEVRRLPAFLEEGKVVKGAARGSVVHFILQHLQLHQGLSSDEIATQIREMESKGLLTSEQVNSVNPGDIAAYFASPLGQRMLQSTQIRREVSFVMPLSSKEIYGTEIDEEVLVQGIIDCYFAEDDGIVLVDYKTDRVYNLATIGKKYQLQLDCYAKAIEKITGRKVKEKYLYLFSENNVLQYT